MLDYETVKRWKRDLMVHDPAFIDGRGRLESVEFHTAKRIYLKGVTDGDALVAKLDEVIELLQTRGPGYGNVLAIVHDVKKQLTFE
jgi:hypothetical protein